MVNPSESSIDLETHRKEIETLNEKHQEQLAALRLECVQACRSFTSLHKAADEEKDKLIRQRETELLDGFLVDIDYLKKAQEQEVEATRVEKFIKFLSKLDEEHNGPDAELPDVVLSLLDKFYSEVEQLRNEQKERRESLVCQKKVLEEKERNAKLQRQIRALRVSLDAAKAESDENRELREQVKELESSKEELTRKLAVGTEKLANLEKASDGAIGFFKARHIAQKKELLSHREKVKELEAKLEEKKEAEESLRNVCARFQSKLDLSKREKAEEVYQLKETVKKRNGQVKRLEKRLKVAGNAICSLKRRKEQLENVDFQQVRKMLKEICGKENHSKSMSSSKRNRSFRKSHLHCVGIVERMLLHQAKNDDFQRREAKNNDDLLEKMYRKIEELARNTEHLAHGQEEMKPSTEL